MPHFRSSGESSADVNAVTALNTEEVSSSSSGIQTYSVCFARVNNLRELTSLSADAAMVVPDPASLSSGCSGARDAEWAGSAAGALGAAGLGMAASSSSCISRPAYTSRGGYRRAGQPLVCFRKRLLMCADSLRVEISHITLAAP